MNQGVPKKEEGGPPIRKNSQKNTVFLALTPYLPGIKVKELKMIKVRVDLDIHRKIQLNSGVCVCGGVTPAPFFGPYFNQVIVP